MTEPFFDPNTRKATRAFYSFQTRREERMAYFIGGLVLLICAALPFALIYFSR